MFMGVDVGRSYVKSFSNQSKDFIKLPSYVARAKELDLSFSSDKDHFNDLNVTINEDRYFIGNKSKKYGGSKEHHIDKVSHDNTLVLLLSSIAIMSDEKFIAPKVVAGLPINVFKEQGRQFKKKLEGHYKVQVNQKNVSIELTKGQFVVFPEGAGAAWDLIFNDKGNINQNLSNSKIALIDIGWKTVNFVVLDNMEFNDSLSGTLNTGMSTAFVDYYKTNSRKLDLSIAEMEDKFMLDCKNNKLEELEDLSKRIQDNLAMFWSEFSSFDHVFLAGGGGVALSSYLDIPAKLIPNAQIANARGFYKIGRNQIQF